MKKLLNCVVFCTAFLFSDKLLGQNPQYQYPDNPNVTGSRLAIIKDGSASQEPFVSSSPSCILDAGHVKNSEKYEKRFQKRKLKGKLTNEVDMKYYSNATLTFEFGYLLDGKQLKKSDNNVELKITEYYGTGSIRGFYVDDFNFDRIAISDGDKIQILKGKSEIKPSSCTYLPNGNTICSARRSISFLISGSLSYKLIKMKNELIPWHYVWRNNYTAKCPNFISSKEIQRVIFRKDEE